MAATKLQPRNTSAMASTTPAKRVTEAGSKWDSGTVFPGRIRPTQRLTGAVARAGHGGSIYCCSASCCRAVATSARQPLGELARCEEEARGREKKKTRGGVAAGDAPGRGIRRTAREVAALGWEEGGRDLWTGPWQVAPSFNLTVNSVYVDF